MSCVGLKINPRVNTDKSLIAQFKDLPVANIGDYMNRLAAVDQSIKPFNKSRLLGSAFTIRLPEGDNLLLHKALDLAEQGDVFVIDAAGATQRAILGELMLSYCRKKGISGILLDGCIRDVEAIAEMDIAVLCKRRDAEWFL
jgi:regulator of RNase E activity RraA